MKRIITILLVFITIASFAQKKQYIPWVKSDTIVNTHTFIWRGDTLDFSQLDSAMFVRYSDAYTEYIVPQQLSDSLDAHKVIHDITLLDDGTAGNPLKVDTSLFPTFDDLLQYLLIADSNKYVTENRFLDTLNNINNMIEQDVFEITLASSTTVAGRISGGATVYPAGWSLAAGTSPVDLVVTHGLNRRVASVTVFAIDGTSEQQLFNTAAYNGVVTTDANTLKIQSLSTIQKVIKIYIIFK